MKVALIPIILFFFTNQIVFSNEADCVDCTTGSLQNCSKIYIEEKNRSLKRRKSIVEISVKSDPENTHAEVFQGYIEELNEVRSCQKQLGIDPERCSLGFRFKQKENEHYEISYDLSFSAEKNNVCIFHPFRSWSVTNMDKIQVVQYLNGAWLPKGQNFCQTRKGNITYKTSRQFNIFDKENGSGILILDWYEEHTLANNPTPIISDSRVSQQIGKRINLKRNSRINVKYDQNIEFMTTDGHTITIDKNGLIINSSIMDPNMYGDKCKTSIWKRGSRSRPYFSPKIELTPEARDLSVSTVRG